MTYDDWLEEPCTSGFDDEPEFDDCPECFGKGMIGEDEECDECGGSGKLREYEEDPDADWKERDDL